MAISPEGNHVSFVGSRDGVRLLYVRALDSLEARALPGTEGIICTPFFSPDGQWLGFYALGKLRKVSIHGGAPVTLMNSPGSFGATWGPDDAIFFADISKTGLTKIAAAGGAPQQITTVDASRGETSHRFPAILPGGKAFLYAVEKRGRADEAEIVEQRLDTGERRVLVVGGTYPSYVPTGYLVYVRAATLMAVPFDLERLVVTGGPVPVADDVWQASRGAAQFAVSSLGSLVYVPSGTGSNDFTMVWVDRKGIAKPLPAPPRFYGYPVLSPDGRRVVLQIAGANYDIWLYDLARDALTRLTFESNNEGALWSPDGKRIAFCSARAGSPYNLFGRRRTAAARRSL
ncbi:MAG: PD40 domain-containing protein [Acidobacteria bacterium]|nr:PD40 domain-containing protein [Acidobacteriota bacterium]